MEKKVKMERTLAEHDCGLSITTTQSYSDSLVIATLQHLSGRPWVVIGLDESQFHDFHIEWAYLTDDVLGEASLVFLTQLRRLQHKKLQLSAFEAEYFKLLAQFSQVDLKDRRVVTIDRQMRISDRRQILPVGSDDVVEAGSPENVDTRARNEFSIEKDYNDHDIFLFEELADRNREESLILRLVCGQSLLYPTPKLHAHNLIQQLNSNGFLKAYCNQVMALQIQERPDQDYVDTLNRIGSFHKRLVDCESIQAIWLALSPPNEGRASLMVEKLIELESSCDLAVQTELRVSLLRLITMELYYPARELVLVQKQKYEEDASHALEKREKLAKQQQQLEANIQKKEAELAKLLADIKQREKEANKKKSKLQKSTSENKQLKEALQKKRAEVEALKEEEAITSLCYSLINLNPEPKLKSKLKELHKTDWNEIVSMGKMTQKLVSILNLPKNEFLGRRAAKELPGDRAQLLDALTSLTTIPEVQVDEDGQPIVRANHHLILSSILQELHNHLNKLENPRQVRIVCQGNLVIDKGLKMPGINLIIVSNNIIVADSTIEIDVSGNHGQRKHATLKAKNGCNEGDKGADGLDGHTGGHGGSVHLEAIGAVINHQNLKFKCGGGAGGDGQNGGDGHKGRKGVDGRNGDLPHPSFWADIFEEYQRIDRGGLGEPGKPGGLGGKGGCRGGGGAGGLALVIASSNKVYEQKHEDGEAGTGGMAGNPGDHGGHGKHGKDDGWSREGLWYDWLHSYDYNLRAIELPGYVKNGYRIAAGREPEYTQQTTKVTQQKQQNTQVLKSTTKANQIKAQSVNALKASVVTTTQTQEMERAARAENAMNKLQEQTQAHDQGLSKTDQELRQQLQEIQDLEVRKRSRTAQVATGKSRMNALVELSAEAERQQEEAENKVKELEQIAVHMKVAQEEALELSATAQHALMHQQITEQTTTVIREAPTNALEEEDATMNTAGGPVSKTSGRLFEIQAKNANYLLFLRLTAEIPTERHALIERNLLDLVRLTKNTISQPMEAFLSKFYTNMVSLKPDAERKEWLQYCSNQFTQDVAYAFTYQGDLLVKKHLSKEFDGETTFVDWVARCRVLTWNEDDDNNEMSDKFKSRIKHLDSILKPTNKLAPQLRRLLSEIHAQHIEHHALIKWNAKTNKKGKFKQGLDIVWGKKLQHMRIVRGIVREGAIFYEKMNRLHIFGCKHLDLEEFLTALLDNDSNGKSSKNMDFSKVLFKDHVNAQWLFEHISADSAHQISTLLPYMNLDLTALDKAKTKVKTLLSLSRQSGAASTNGTNSDESPLHQLKDDLLNYYRRVFQAPSLAQIRRKLKEDDDKLRTVEKEFVALIESEFLDLAFSTRIEQYEQCENALKGGGSSLDKCLSSLYAGSGHSCVDTQSSSLVMNEFLNAITKAIDAEGREGENSLLNRTLCQLHVGKLWHGRLVPFSTEELVRIEATVWDNLHQPESKDACSKLGSAIQAVLPEVDLTKVKAKCDVNSLESTSESLIASLLEFMPIDSNESGTIDPRIRNYVKFSICRLQLYLVQQSRCREMQKLREKLDALDKSNVGKILEVIDEFTAKHVPPSITQHPAYQNGQVNLSQIHNYLKTVFAICMDDLFFHALNSVREASEEEAEVFTLEELQETIGQTTTLDEQDKRYLKLLLRTLTLEQRRYDPPDYSDLIQLITAEMEGITFTDERLKEQVDRLAARLQPQDKSYLDFSVKRFTLFLLHKYKDKEQEDIDQEWFDKFSSDLDALQDAADVDRLVDEIRDKVEPLNSLTIREVLNLFSWPPLKKSSTEEESEPERLFMLLLHSFICPTKNGLDETKASYLREVTAEEGFKRSTGVAAEHLDPDSTNYPTGAVLEELNHYRQRWRHVETILEEAKRLRQESLSTMYYACANSLHQAQEIVNNQLNLLNVKNKDNANDMLVKLNALYPVDSNKQRTSDGAKYEVHVQIQTRDFYCNFPFDVEMELLLRSASLDSNKLLVANHKLIQALLNEDVQDKDRLWTTFLAAFKDKVTSTPTHLAKVLLSIPYSHPCRRLLVRLIQKGLGDTSRPAHALLNIEGATTQEVLYRLVAPEFNPSTIKSTLLLGPDEQLHVESLVRLLEKHGGKNQLEIVLGRLTTRMEAILSTKIPTVWAGHLEKLHFDTIFQLLFSLNTAQLEQKESLHAIVRQQTLITSKRGRLMKRLLRMLQTKRVLEEFKLTYLLCHKSDRGRLLQLLAFIYEELETESFTIFSTVKDACAFLVFIRDIPMNTLESIVRNSFHFNWFKHILLECILHDAKPLTGANPKMNTTREPSIEMALSQFVAPPLKEPKLRFLRIFHPKLKAEIADASSSMTITDIVNILNGVNRIGMEQLSRLAAIEFKVSPLSYWPRLIRLESLRARNLSSKAVEKCMAMDTEVGQRLVDQLLDACLSDKMPEEEMMRVLVKFSSGEWILEQATVDILIRSVNRFKLEVAFDEIDKYCANKRKKELNLDQLITEAKAHPMNQRKATDNEQLLNLIHAQVQRIRDTLNGSNSRLSSKFLHPITERAQYKEDLAGLHAQWQKKYKDRSWTIKFSSEDLVVLDTIVLIYRAMEYHMNAPPSPQSKSETESTTLTKVKESGPTITRRATISTPAKEPRSPRNSQLVALLFLISGLAKGVGKMGEINTGEGKSCIVAMFASFCALLKARVHVITSNSVLAIEDEVRYRDYFASLGLKVGNNCDKKANGDKERAERYNNHVVYGELSGFQGDLLNTEFHGKEIMSLADVLIVDEVDSLLLDKGANMLYLSHTIPELKYLRPILLVIWDAVSRKLCTPCSWRQYSLSDINNVRASVEARLRSDRELRYPSCMTDFVSRRLEIWIKQAFVARFMPVNEDYIIEENKYRVVNMDADTGVEQTQMQLSFGLHQFLQLKYKTKVSAETLKCVFMSNLKYFQRHKGKLFGITGTLGGPEETQLLAHEYYVEFFGMPRFKLNKQVEEEALISTESADWWANITTSVATHCEKQPILIITQNIAKLNLILQQIRKHADLQHRLIAIHLYQSSDKDQKFTEEVKQRKGLKPGELVLSTNLGGRGTDLEIHKDAEELGLHVILSYLPTNIRVEKQAFGRTARAGGNGTVQFIIQHSASTSSTSATTSASAGQQAEEVKLTIESVKEERRKREGERVERIRQKDLPKIKIEDELFDEYTKFVHGRVKRSPHLLKHPKRIRELQLQFLNNRWAVWLDSIRHSIDCLHLQHDVGKVNVMNQFKEFTDSLMVRLEDSSCGFAQFTSELIRLGKRYETVGSKTTFSTAMEANFEELDNIYEENKEYVTSGQMWKDFKSLLPFTEKVPPSPSNYQLSLQSLQQANKVGQDQSKSDLNGGKGTADKGEGGCLTEVSQLYSGAVALQMNPLDKNTTKDFLLKSRKEILLRMEQHASEGFLLDEVSKHAQPTTADAGSENDPSKGQVEIQNKFQEQINSENNLLQHHVDAINTALQSPLDPKYFKHHVKAIDSEDESQRLFQLLTNDGQLCKNYRLTSKLFSNDPQHKNFNLESVTGKLKESAAPCSSDALIQLLKEFKENHKPVLGPTDFDGLVITKIGFLRALEKHGFVRSIADSSQSEESLDLEFIEPSSPNSAAVLKDGLKKPAIILLTQDQLNKERAGKERKTFPQKLMVYADAVTKILLDRYLELYDHSLFASLLQGDEQADQVELEVLLKTTLLQFGWIQTRNLPFRIVRDRMNAVRLNKLGNESLPQEIDLYERILSSQQIRITNSLFRQTALVASDEELLQLKALPFPNTKAEGRKIILDCLIEQGWVKCPVVILSSKCPGEKEVEVRLKQIRQRVETKHTDQIRKIFDEFHRNTKNDEKEKDAEFKVYLNNILEVLIASVGSLKLHHKIRVNYNAISSRIPLESNHCCEELQQWIQEALFDQLVTFDELVPFYKNYGALGILLLGAVEVAAGVAIEIFSGGLLSPLAAVLISEGASDMYYSCKHLYDGNRPTLAKYKSYKKTSLKWSVGVAAVAGFFPFAGVAFQGTKHLLKAIVLRLITALGKSFGKALLLSFIENKIQESISNNQSSLNSLLDSLLLTEEFQAEVTAYNSNATALLKSTSGPKEAGQILRKVAGGIVPSEEDVTTTSTKFELQLEKLLSDITGTQMVKIMMQVVKMTMPISCPAAFEGWFASNDKNSQANMPYQEQIQTLILQTMRDLNEQIKSKTEKLEADKQTMPAKDEDDEEQEEEADAFVDSAAEQEFQKAVDQIMTGFKQKIKMQVVNAVFEFFAGHKMKEHMHESIRVSYEAYLSYMKIPITEFLAASSSTDNTGEPNSQDDAKDVSQRNDDHVLVVNAGGQTKKQVETSTPYALPSEVEFLSDLHGNTYVILNSTASLAFGFMIGSHETALQEYRTWMADFASK